LTLDRPPVVLDTNVVSYIFNGDSRAVYYRERLLANRQVISFQTLEESLFGAHLAHWGDSRVADLLGYLDSYRVIWPTDDLVDVCARLRAERRAAGRELEMQDAWIAATALFLRCPLASQDSHFAGIPNLELVKDPSP
jgi:tRNA(fMet)-specific endonuclease VapC